MSTVQRNRFSCFIAAGPPTAFAIPPLLKPNNFVAERSWYLVALDPIVFADYAERFDGE